MTFPEVEPKKPREITAKQALYLVDLGFPTSEIRKMNFNEARENISCAVEKRKRMCKFEIAVYSNRSGYYRDDYDYDSGDFEY